MSQPAQAETPECPVGQWRRDLAHLDENLRAHGSDITHSGEMILTLAADGEVRMEYREFADNLNGKAMTTSNGASTGTWSTGATVSVQLTDEAAASLQTETTAEIALPGTFTVRWTSKGVTKVSPNPGYAVAVEYNLPNPPAPFITKEGSLGPLPLFGRNSYRCEGNDDLFVGGGHYTRM